MDEPSSTPPSAPAPARAADRLLAVAGLANARDLGGIPYRTGGTTAAGVFFRSENLDQTTRAGWDQLYAAGIRTVVDLRQPGERAQDSQPRPDWLTTVPVDLDGLENTAFWADYWDNGLVGTALYYLPHLAAMPERSGAALAALARAAPGGVLFHCAAGRDRTGQIALLLLTIAGAEPEAIVDDYLETVRRGDQRAVASGRAHEEAESEALCRSFGTTTEGAFRTALAGLDLPAVLAAAGITDTELATLRSWRQSRTA
ncbi:protein-tyrosine phosphatase [Cryobacterium sp. MP_3.1]|uniref:tyrosine-protein phosphatase n=1 Tax=Cryobacterium sp. MP_3.1 TaxID=3071711 RepID=UPI002E0A366A|nr:protein-tyrosine phosphatase [Cryobacterium sp. MP_3.1]